MEGDADSKPLIEDANPEESQIDGNNEELDFHSKHLEEDTQDDQQHDEQDEEEVDVQIKLEPDDAAPNPDIRVKTEPSDANGNDNDNDNQDQDNNNADEEKADDEDDDDEDDHVKVTIDDDVPDYNLRAKQRQPQQAKPVAAIDLDAQQPILDVDINTIEDKPWRKPGADISDYFNYGFDEDTWKLYCEKQKKMKSIVNEVTCSTSETTFKIPVMPTNEHSKYSPARMIPTIVSNESRFNAWVPPTIGSSNEPDHQEQNHSADHRLIDVDNLGSGGGGIGVIGGHGSHAGHMGGGMLRGNIDMGASMRDREINRGGHMRSQDSHSLERMRDRDRKHDRDRDREVITERDNRGHRGDRDITDRDSSSRLSDRHRSDSGVVVDRFDRDIEVRNDLRHRIDRLKEEREHVDSDHHHHQSSHRSHSSSRSEKHQHHGITSASDKHSSDRLESSKHGSSSDRLKEHRSDKSSRDRTSDKRTDRESSGKSSSRNNVTNAERVHRSHRSEATGSKKRDRSKDRSKDRGERDKRRKRAHD